MTSRLKDTLLLVSDEAKNRAELREIFESEFHFLEAENLHQGALLLEQNDSCIAAVLLEHSGVDEEGVRLMNRAAHQGSDTEIPIIVIINVTEGGLREERAFARGASDVVLRPYTPTAIRRRVKVLVDLHLHRWHLQNLVQEQQKIIRNNNQVMLDALSAIIEHRSTESGNHVLRIRRFTKILLEDVAKNCPEYGLDENTIDVIVGAATLHDIGKIAIPDAVLNKPGKLTPAEFEIIKTHTTVGADLIRNLERMGDTEYLRYAYNIARYHHERWDGNGYPCGLEGENIPICAQVVSIADVFDALTTARVYKPALPFEVAINMIINHECGVFSPKLIECFKHVRPALIEMATQYADGYSPKDESITMPLSTPRWESSPLDTAQLSLVKYRTVLHHMNDTVMELDLDHRLIHVVYNPDPDLESFIDTAAFAEAEGLLNRVRIHPEDTDTVREMYAFLTEQFFQLNMRRKNYYVRIFSHVQGDWQRYKITFLRVNTGNDFQRIVISVWHRVTQGDSTQAALVRQGLHSLPAMMGLSGAAVRCLTDRDMTIDAGAEDLFLLTGYTEAEIAREFGGHLMSMVVPEDRESFLQETQNHFRQGGQAEYELRMIHKHDATRWVKVRSRLDVERDGREYFYHSIQDDTRAKTLEQELRGTIERNQIIVDQSGGIVFEWDQKSDTMYLSNRWNEHFGYPPVTKNYGTQMGIATHFHPDDLPTVRNAILEIRSNGASANLDVRIADSNARYLWTRISATGIRDENGELTRIIGILQDVDALKRAELALKERAERDALTKLYNKTSAQQLATNYLFERDPDSHAALVMLDLDNFKAVNDNYGHLYGDTVLSQMGATLRQMFRSNDIIGRIGGDEFLILMRDIPNAELAVTRCGQLLDTLRPMLENLAPGYNLSCSIGAALVPEHGVSYTDLFRRADEALYVSKKAGKNTFTVYDPKESLVSRTRESGHTPTRIDSDNQPGMADASFVRFVFRHLYESSDIIAAFDEILAYVGQQLNVSRVYIFENNEDNTACSNTFEWCNEGVQPEIDNLQNVSYIDDISGWPEVFDERGVFYCTDITRLEPHFRAILEPQGIKSMLQCALLDNGVFRGYVGFDECSVHRMWTQDQISLLQFLAEVLGIFLLKKRVQDRAVAQSKDLHSILDQQDAWIYVIDPETCRLKFLNRKARQLAPEGSEGAVCYQTFRNRDSRCEDCPAAGIGQEEVCSVLINDYCSDIHARAKAARITWNGEESCLITCQEIPSAVEITK